MNKVHKIIIHSIFVLLLASCTTWQQVKQAAYNATTDTLTWVPAATAATLYATGYDENITQYFMKHPLYKINTQDDDNIVASLSWLIPNTTALFVPESVKSKINRFAVENAALAISRSTTSRLNLHVNKRTPDGEGYWAIGSHHALTPFTGAKLTSNNIAETTIHRHIKQTIIGANYALASVSAFSRVQNGGHSVADQLVSVFIGNFIGAFFYDSLIEESIWVQAKVAEDDYSVTINLAY